MNGHLNAGVLALLPSEPQTSDPVWRAWLGPSLLVLIFRLTLKTSLNKCGSKSVFNTLIFYFQYLKYFSVPERKAG